MKIGEVRDLSTDQLDEQLVALKREQFNLRFQQASGQLENSSRMRQVRRDVAKVKTVQRELSAKSADKVEG